jgi:hypothetical protein
MSELINNFDGQQHIELQCYVRYSSYAEEIRFIEVCFINSEFVASYLSGYNSECNWNDFIKKFGNKYYDSLEDFQNNNVKLFSDWARENNLNTEGKIENETKLKACVVYNGEMRYINIKFVNFKFNGVYIGNDWDYSIESWDKFTEKFGSEYYDSLEDYKKDNVKLFIHWIEDHNLDTGE